MQDFRLAAGALRSTPIVTAVAVLSLALGIGANSAIFSLVNSLLLRSLPVKDPARLALMTHGTAGALRGKWMSELLVRQLSTPSGAGTGGHHVVLDLAMDWRVLGFTFAVTAATVFLFGVVPALRASAVAPIEALKDRGPAVADKHSVGATGGLVVAQVALSLVLVAAAGLFGRTFVSLTSLHLGFDPRRVLIVNVNAQGSVLDPHHLLSVY